MKPTIHSISFEEAKELWASELWPGRQSPIEPVSAIDDDGEINMELMRAMPVFLAFRENGKISGVVSGFKTSPTKFRSRGLWVSPNLRGMGFGFQLLEGLTKVAAEAGCSAMWTMARFDAWPFYEKAGFSRKLDIDKYEFGPHVICEKSW